MVLQILILKTLLIKAIQNKTSSKFQVSSSAISEKSFQDESENNSNLNKDDSNINKVDKEHKSKYSRAKTKNSPVPHDEDEDIFQTDLPYNKQKTELIKEIEYKSGIALVNQNNESNIILINHEEIINNIFS